MGCNLFVLYGVNKCSMAFVPIIGYSNFSDVTRNGTGTKFLLSLLRETPTSTPSIIRKLSLIAPSHL